MVAVIFFAGMKSYYFGRSPSGRAIRCNAGFVTSPNISTAIPNAKHHLCFLSGRGRRVRKGFA
jgi:hypothetical protein